MNKPYKVTITETFKMDVEIQSNDVKDAVKKAQENYLAGEYSFESDDHVDTVIEANEVEH